MSFEHLLGQFGVYVTTLVVSLVAGFIPLDIMEVYLVSVAAVTPRSQGVPIVALAAFGQMVGKTIIFLAAAGVIKLSLKKQGDTLERIREKLSHWKYGISALVMVSACVGVPPFYWVTVAAGAGRLNLPFYITAGYVGRFLRFGLFVFFPHLIKGLLR